MQTSIKLKSFNSKEIRIVLLQVNDQILWVAYFKHLNLTYNSIDKFGITPLIQFHLLILYHNIIVIIRYFIRARIKLLDLLVSSKWFYWSLNKWNFFTLQTSIFMKLNDKDEDLKSTLIDSYFSSINSKYNFLEIKNGQSEKFLSSLAELEIKISFHWWKDKIKQSNLLLKLFRNISKICLFFVLVCIIIFFYSNNHLL